MSLTPHVPVNHRRPRPPIVPRRSTSLLWSPSSLVVPAWCRCTSLAAASAAATAVPVGQKSSSDTLPPHTPCKDALPRDAIDLASTASYGALPHAGCRSRRRSACLRGQRRSQPLLAFRPPCGGAASRVCARLIRRIGQCIQMACTVVVRDCRYVHPQPEAATTPISAEQPRRHLSCPATAAQSLCSTAVRPQPCVQCESHKATPIK